MAFGWSTTSDFSQILEMIFIAWMIPFFALIIKPYRAAIPPPEFEAQVPPQPEAATDSEEPERPFACTCSTDDGSQCTARFRTRQQLAVHMANTRGGSHGEVPDYKKLVVTNQCVFCKHVFCSLRTTENHVRRALAARRCTGQGSQTVFSAQMPPTLQCTFCEWKASDLPTLLDHVAGHVQQPPVRAA